MSYRPVLPVLFALLLPLTACLKTEVTCEGDASCGDAPGQSSGHVGQGQGGGAPDDHGSGGAGPEEPDATSTALAFRDGELPDVVGSGESSSASSGGGGGANEDSGALLVFVSDQPMTCGNPYGPSDCGSHWSFTVRLPVELQQPGVYAFAIEGDATHVTAFESITGPGSGDECYGGGGTADDGTFEVTSIDDQFVTGHLRANTYDSAIGVVDVDFVAPICP